jgi:hypothetical protein
MLNLRGMHPIEHDVSGAPRHLPLTLPAELWASLSPAQQAVYRRAESLLDVFSTARELPLARLLEHGPRAEVLRALQVLGSMSLVEIATGDSGPTVTLRALPDEHVRVTGPDSRARWIFVARPIEPPDIALTDLN